MNLNGKYHEEWNPLKYTKSSNESQLYNPILVFIRYNANNENAETNQLSFNELKHCRLQIYPNKITEQPAIQNTINMFKFLGLETEYKNLYN